MKLKKKLILDAILLVLLVILMDYSMTGGLVHEALGFVLMAGFMAHVAVNRKYYRAAVRGIRSGRMTAKSKTAFAINIILPIATIVMLISSLAISRDLVPGIAAMFRGNLWVPIHIICAVVMLICVFVHILMHTKLFDRLIAEGTADRLHISVKRAGIRVAALLFAVMIAKSSFSNMVTAMDSLPGADNGTSEFGNSSGSQKNESIIEKDESYSDDSYDLYFEPEEESEQELTLEEYLGSLFCSGCGKHCSLLSLQCGRGQRELQQAEADYYETYSEESV